MVPCEICQTMVDLMIIMFIYNCIRNYNLEENDLYSKWFFKYTK